MYSCTYIYLHNIHVCVVNIDNGLYFASFKDLAVKCDR